MRLFSEPFLNAS